MQQMMAMGNVNRALVARGDTGEVHTRITKGDLSAKQDGALWSEQRGEAAVKNGWWWWWW
jgi:hypothetical protein